LLADLNPLHRRLARAFRSAVCELATASSIACVVAMRGAACVNAFGLVLVRRALGLPQKCAIRVRALSPGAGVTPPPRGVADRPWRHIGAAGEQAAA
jgi:hypothetical protein